jgi:hypothetical protein
MRRSGIGKVGSAEKIGSAGKLERRAGWTVGGTASGNGYGSTADDRV